MTRKQAALLRFIRLYQERHKGVSPSVREMAPAIGSRTPSAVVAMLKRLERNGHIVRPMATARSVQIINPACPKCGHNLRGQK